MLTLHAADESVAVEATSAEFDPRFRTGCSRRCLCLQVKARGATRLQEDAKTGGLADTPKSSSPRSSPTAKSRAWTPPPTIAPGKGGLSIDALAAAARAAVRSHGTSSSDYWHTTDCSVDQQKVAFLVRRHVSYVLRLSSASSCTHFSTLGARAQRFRPRQRRPGISVCPAKSQNCKADARGSWDPEKACHVSFCDCLDPCSAWLFPTLGG